MATTISIRVAGKAINGQGSNGADGNNGPFGLKAKLAAGVAILGCAATLLLGGVWAAQATQPQPQPATSATSLPAGTDDLATTGCIGIAGPFACQAGQSLVGTDDLALIGCVAVPGPFGCAIALPTATTGTDDLATNGCIGTAGPFACATDWEQQARGSESVSVAVTSDPFLYREDRRVGSVTPSWAPDPFTYREDRRAR